MRNGAAWLLATGLLLDTGLPARVLAEDCRGYVCLEEIIVTVSGDGRQRFGASISSSELGPGQRDFSGTRNLVTLLQSVPGVRAESSGGEGNANLSLRGLPISAGGARYLQFQEDGLPVLLFGDIAFATADQFLRMDDGVARIEVVRGGAAATLASNAPGGVVNLISQHSQSAGGALSVSQGLDFDQQRYDFSHHSGEVLPGLSGTVSGFYRRSNGSRGARRTLAEGGQLRLGVDYRWDAGEIHLYARQLDDQVPMDMPVPVRAEGKQLTTLPGIDPRRSQFYSRYWGGDVTFDRNNRVVVTPVSEGLTVTSNVVGASVVVAPSPSMTLRSLSRVATNDGRFVAVFPADNGYLSGPFTQAAGPEPGAAYGGDVFTATVFNVAIDDASNLTNDTSLAKRWQLAQDRELSATLGYFYGVQDVDLTWQFNQYLMGLVAQDAPLIGSDDTLGTVPGLLASGTDVWGGCCNRSFAVRYRNQAPYVALAWADARTRLDLGLRRESQQAKGMAVMAAAQRYDVEAAQGVDYGLEKTGVSAGVAHQLTAEVAVYGGLSDAYGFNADRILYSGFPLDGSGAIPVNRVRQRELGLRWQRGPWRGVLTAFAALTGETNYEATTQQFTRRRYRARGIEAELGYAWGNFDLLLGVTVTDAEIDKAEEGDLRGNSPRRQPRWNYQLQPSYRFGWGAAGLSLSGSGATWGDDRNTLRLPGYAIASGFVKWQASDALSLTLSVNNIGNALVFTEVEGDGHAARAMPGRSVQLALRSQW